jgi:hypothetical protein
VRYCFEIHPMGACRTCAGLRLPAQNRLGDSEPSVLAESKCSLPFVGCSMPGEPLGSSPRRRCRNGIGGAPLGADLHPCGQPAHLQAGVQRALRAQKRVRVWCVPAVHVCVCELCEPRFRQTFIGCLQIGRQNNTKRNKCQSGRWLTRSSWNRTVSCSGEILFKQND